MTRILPPVAPLASEPIARVHSPVGKYTTFRDCLRWEFGFSCPLCLLHERDVITTGVDGWAVVTIEHRETQSDHPDVAHAYENCVYACRRCNTTRGSRTEAHLLDPTEVAWDAHFARIEDDLEPKDLDAMHTVRLYGLNDRERVAIRQRRRKRIAQLRSDRLRVIEALDSDWLPEQGRPLLLGLLVNLENQLREWAAIPTDAPTACRCTQPCALPAHALTGLWELD